MALRDIKVGECLLEEEPLIAVPSPRRVEWPLIIAWCAWSWNWETLGTGLESWIFWISLAYVSKNVIIKLGEYVHVCYRFSKLDDDDKKSYNQLHNWYKSVIPFCDVLTIWRSNALPNEPGRGAVFAKACLINHSCDPNAYHYWNVTTKRMMVHCIRPIKRGEEVTISYLSVFRSKADRQQELEWRYRFTCNCQVCQLTDEKLKVSDEQRSRCAFLFEGSARRKLFPNKEESLKEVEELIDLLDKEFGDPSYKGDAAWEASTICRAMNNAKLARVWATKAHQLLLLTRGPFYDLVQEAKKATSQ